MKTRTQHIATAILAATLAISAQGAYSQDNGAGTSGFKTRLLIGNSSLESDWDRHDEQGVIGMVAEYQGNNWPVAIAADLFGAGDEQKRNGEKDEAYIASAHFGLRLKCDDANSWIQPYVGAGVAFANAELKPEKSEDDGVGYWIGAGADFPVAERFSVGVDLRYWDVEVELADEANTSQTLNAGGTQFGVTLGYRW